MRVPANSPAPTAKSNERMKTGSDLPAFVRDKLKRKWENAMILSSRTFPTYELPWDGNEINTIMMEQYHPTSLYIAYLPLPFYAYSMWPCEWNALIYNSVTHDRYDDASHPERFANMFCVACKERIERGQMVIHIISGVLRNKRNTPALTTDVRLLCNGCTTSSICIEKLVYFPHMLMAQTIVNTFIKPMKRIVIAREHAFLNQARTCHMCDNDRTQNHIVGAFGKMFKVCDDKKAHCMSALYTMSINDTLKYAAYPYMPACERVSDLMCTIMDASNDMRNMCCIFRWNYCNQCYVTMDIGDTGYECTVCCSVQYCGIKCAKKGRASHQRVCESWKDIANVDHLVDVYTRSPSMYNVMEMYKHIETKLDARGINQCPLLHGGIDYPSYPIKLKKLKK